jgi:hypothetical protein
MQIKTFGHFTLILWKVILIMKTCLLLFCMVVLNFRNFTKLVWINLDQIWKVFEEIKKTEMEKEKRRKKNRIGPRGNLSAQHRIQPIAQLIKPEAVPLSPSFPRRQVGPTCHPSPPADSSPSYWKRPGFTPLFNSLNPLPVSISHCAYKMVSTPLLLPFRFLVK